MKNIGSVETNKGLLHQVKTIVWDAVPQCNKTCPIYKHCTFSSNTHIKCDLRKQYTRNVLTTLDEAFKNQDTLAIHKIGFMLIPLYQQLITFKIHLLNTGHNPIVKTKVNPLYKEMRDTIRLINTMLKDIDEEDNSGRLDKNGDPDYYNNFVSGEEDY